MNVSDYTNASVCHMSNVLAGLAILKEGNDAVDLIGKEHFYDDDKGKEISVSGFWCLNCVCFM